MDTDEDIPWYDGGFHDYDELYRPEIGENKAKKRKREKSKKLNQETNDVNSLHSLEMTRKSKDARLKKHPSTSIDTCYVVEGPVHHFPGISAELSKRLLLIHCSQPTSSIAIKSGLSHESSIDTTTEPDDIGYLGGIDSIVRRLQPADLARLLKLELEESGSSSNKHVETTDGDLDDAIILLWEQEQLKNRKAREMYEYE